MAKPRTLGEAIQNIEKVLKFAARQRVLVGIPAEKAQRNDSALNNASLGYLHEYGAPEANIPARPFLNPGMEASEAMIAEELRRAGDKAITLAADGDVSGGKEAITTGLHRIGLKAVNNVRGVIQAGISPPLSARTVYARLHRRKNRRTGPDMTPLIDTGKLLASITYVIRN